MRECNETETKYAPNLIHSPPCCFWEIGDFWSDKIFANEAGFEVDSCVKLIIMCDLQTYLQSMSLSLLIGCLIRQY